MKLIELINESINDKGIYKAVFMAGIPGSGKSHISKILKIGTIGPKIVDMDRNLENLATKQGDNPGERSTWQKHGKKAINLTQSQLYQYVNGMLPLIIDGTGSNPAAVNRRMQVLRAVGYDISMVWVNADIDVAQQRVSTRDRKVPQEHQTRMQDELNSSKEFYIGHLNNNFIEVSNTQDTIDPSVDEAYKKLQSFFNSNVNNHIGLDNINTLKHSGEKYLVPSVYTEEELSQYVNAWYSK